MIVFFHAKQTSTKQEYLSTRNLIRCIDSLGMFLSYIYNQKLNFIEDINPLENWCRPQNQTCHKGCVMQFHKVKPYRPIKICSLRSDFLGFYLLVTSSTIIIKSQSFFLAEKFQSRGAGRCKTLGVLMTFLQGRWNLLKIG